MPLACMPGSVCPPLDPVNGADNAVVVRWWIGRCVGGTIPGSLAELRAWFPDDEACTDYLEWLRWPTWFVSPLRGAATDGGRVRRVWPCSACAQRVSRPRARSSTRPGRR